VCEQLAHRILSLDAFQITDAVDLQRDPRWCGIEQVGGIFGGCTLL